MKSKEEFSELFRSEYEKMLAKKVASGSEIKNNALVIDGFENVINEYTFILIAIFIPLGPSLTYFDSNNQELREIFIKIGKMCRSVIACRLTPIQKKDLVNIVFF